MKNLTAIICLTATLFVGSISVSVGSEQKKQENHVKRGLSCAEIIRRTALDNMVLFAENIIKKGCKNAECDPKKIIFKDSWEVKNEEPVIFFIFENETVFIFSAIDKQLNWTYSDHYREADFFINWSDYSYNDPSSDSVGVRIIDIVPPHRRMTYKLNRENLRLGVAYEHKMIMPPTAQKNWDDSDISGMSKFFQCSKMPPSDIEKIIDQKKELFKTEYDERKQKIRERLGNRKF